LARVLIVGFGNLLLRDEGLGIHAVQALEKRDLPEGVEVMDGGTSAIDILPYLEAVDLLIVVDCVDGNQPPGTLYRMGLTDIKYEQEAHMSLHDINVPAVLQLMKAMGKRPPQTLIIGLQPAAIEEGLDLTEEVAAAMPRLLDYVLSQAKAFLAHPEELPPR
jgi:hydrogenase maturation protease